MANSAATKNAFKAMRRTIREKPMNILLGYYISFEDSFYWVLTQDIAALHFREQFGEHRCDKPYHASSEVAAQCLQGHLIFLAEERSEDCVALVTKRQERS
jgi:hypothetical protein